MINNLHYTTVFFKKLFKKFKKFYFSGEYIAKMDAIMKAKGCKGLEESDSSGVANEEAEDNQSSPDSPSIEEASADAGNDENDESLDDYMLECRQSLTGGKKYS